MALCTIDFRHAVDDVKIEVCFKTCKVTVVPSPIVEKGTYAARIVWT